MRWQGTMTPMGLRPVAAPAARALAWPDAFPHTDLGVMKALGTKDPKRVLAAAEAWRPWRAYAVMHLWNSLAKD